MALWSARAARVRRWFFPEAVELPEGLDRLIGIVYPRLDRRRVSFHRGLPHFLKLIPNQAITLPGLAPRSGRVYIHPDCWRPGSVEGLGLFVHESYHLLQLQESGWGLGLARPFIVLYLACAAANRFRYEGHPMESDAYRVAGMRASVFEAAVDPALVPAAHLAGEPGCECPDLTPLASCCTPAVTAASGLAFWRKLALSTPGYGLLAGVKPLVLAVPARLVAGLLVGLWLLLWSLATIVLAAAELLVRAVGLVAAGVLAAISGVAGVSRVAGSGGPVSPEIAGRGGRGDRAGRRDPAPRG